MDGETKNPVFSLAILMSDLVSKTVCFLSIKWKVIPSLPIKAWWTVKVRKKAKKKGAV